MYYELLEQMQEISFTDNVVNGASYIMVDGKFCDFRSIGDEQMLKARTKYPYVIHPDFDRFYMNLVDTSFIPNRIVYADNAIKINDGYYETSIKPYIVLPQNDITEEQYKTIELWVCTLKKGTLLVSIIDTKHSVIFEDISHIDAKDILNGIKKLYIDFKKDE